MKRRERRQIVELICSYAFCSSFLALLGLYNKPKYNSGELTDK